MKGPLTGIRVLALENYLAGPVASMTMGDLGAEVIKIEPPQGDLSRQTAGPNHKGESSHFLSWNRNKNSIVLDLRTNAGKEAFFGLVRISDIVINNFRLGVMARLGISHDKLVEINPRIISVNITGMGTLGPDKDRPSVDSTAAGWSGILSVTGEPGGRPVRPGPAMSDLANAQYAVIAALSALYQREHTGAGQNIDVSLLGASVAYMGYHISYYTCSGEVPEPLGSGYPFTTPYGAYKTADGYVVLGPCWPRIARAIGADWLVEDPRFATTARRLQNRRELDAEIEKYLANANTDEWLNIFYAEDIVAGPLHQVDEVVADPQVNTLGMILEIPHPLGGSIKVAGSPIRMDSITGENTAPPTLGQHTEEVLHSLLHYSPKQLRSLKSEQDAAAADTKSHVWKEK
jgi:crotonobetainyl-CoA:carnitine CoA-transferase CaiB-like acyl-CoA transferase